MKRQNAAAGPNGDVLCHGRNGSAGDGRIRVWAAKGMKMALRGPHSVEAVLIGKFGSVQKQLIFAGARGVVVSPVEKTELHCAGTSGRGRLQRVFVILQDDDLEAVRQRPEQLQHGDVER